MVTLLVPSLNKSREASMSAICKSKLGQCGIAATFYAKDNNMYYPGTTGGGDYSSSGALKEGGDTSEWMITLMPYLDIKAVEKNNIIFKCPMSKLADYEEFDIPGKHDGGLAWSHGMGRVYYSVQGNPLTHRKKPLVKLQQIEIPSESLMMGDTRDNPNKTKNVKAITIPSEGNINGDDVGKRHNKGMNVLWTDTSVSWKSQNHLRAGKNGLIDYYFLMVKE